MTGSEWLCNPFAVRHILPGATPYLFADGLNAEVLVRRLAGFGWRGAVIGPHGSGKSTLLASLAPLLDAAGRPPWRVALHDGQRTLRAAAWQALSCLAPCVVVVIDGYEQLGWWARRRVWFGCWRRGCGLVVTAHGPVGLPVLLRTEVTPQTARRVIKWLRPDSEAPPEVEMSDRLRACRGNFREVLFEMYDEYESARRLAAPALA